MAMRRRLIRLLLLVLAGVVFAAALVTVPLWLGFGRGFSYRPREGDVVFQSLARSQLIDAIEGSTKSPYSHCGLVARKGLGWVVIEAMGPVHESDLDAWIQSGRDGAFSAYRLKEPWRESISGMVSAARVFIGTPYDIHYDLDDAKIYCSELVYKAFQRATGQPLGRLQRLGDLHWQPHEDLIRQIEKGGLPLDRQMITPRALSEAPELEKIGDF
jgi:hypothetical protein